MKYSLQKRISAFVLAFALVMTTAFNSIGATTKADAAAKVKTLYLTQKTTSLVEGETGTAQWAVRATKATKALAAVKVTTSDSSVVKITKTTQSKKAGKTAKAAKKNKGTVKFTAVSAGTATIKIVTKKKTKKTKSFKVTVTAKATEAPASSDATTQAPASADATTQASANATTTEDVNEFALVSVESAVEAGSGSYKYLKVKFSKKLDSLAASEVTIRRKSDDQLYTVDKVTLDADGMGAYVELLGDASAANGSLAAGINFLESNTPYVFRVEKAGEKAAIKEFVIPANWTNATITEVDPVNKKIKVTNSAGTATQTLDASANAINIGYYDALGRIVTVKYNEKSEIVSIKFTDGGVVYGTFKVDDTNAGKYTDTTTKAVYSDGADTGAGVLKVLGASGYKYNTGATAPKATYGNAKLILNSNNKVASIVVPNTTTASYVTSSDGVRFVKTLEVGERNLKDYTFIKGDSYVDIKAVKVNSTVFLDTTNKIAAIYENSETVTLDNTSIYDDKVKLGSSELSYATDLAGTLYIDEKPQAASYANFKIAQAGGPVNVFKYANGSVAFVIAKSGAVKTSTEAFILAKNFKAATNMNTEYLQGTLMNDKKTLNLSTVSGENMLPLSQISKFTLYSGTNKFTTEKGIKKGATWTNGGVAEVTDAATVGTFSDKDLNAVAVGSYVVVEYDTTNKIVGLTITDITSTNVNNQVIALAVSNEVKVGMQFNTTAVTTSATTPVYLLQDDDATAGTLTEVKGVKLNTLSSYSTKLGATNGISYGLIDDKKNTVAIVVTDTELGVNNEAKTTVTGIVTDVTLADNKLVRIKYINKGSSDETTAVSFDATDAAAQAKFTKNTIQSIGIKENGDVATGASKTSGDLGVITAIGSSANTADSDSITLSGDKLYRVDSTVLYKFEGGKYTILPWTDLVDNKAKVVTLTYLPAQGVAGKIDLGIVVFDNNTAKAAEAYRIANLISAGTTIQTAIAGTTSLQTYDTTGVTAAGVNLTGATYNVSKVSGTGTFNDANATTITGTSIAANDVVNVVITTALGNTITIRVKAVITP